MSRALRGVVGVILAFTATGLVVLGLLAPLTPSDGRPSLKDYLIFLVVPSALFFTAFILHSSRMMKIVIALWFAGLAIFVVQTAVAP